MSCWLLMNLVIIVRLAYISKLPKYGVVTLKRVQHHRSDYDISRWVWYDFNSYIRQQNRKTCLRTFQCIKSFCSIFFIFCIPMQNHNIEDCHSSCRCPSILHRQITGGDELEWQVATGLFGRGPSEIMFVNTARHLAETPAKCLRLKT